MAVLWTDVHFSQDETGYSYTEKEGENYLFT